MWEFFENKILYTGGGAGFDWNPIVPAYAQSGRNIITLASVDIEWCGYDHWVGKHDSKHEINLVQSTLEKAKNDISYRAHIRGISLADSVEMLRNFYRERGHEDSLDKNYTLPDTVQVTANISLRHALWCEKDKQFLSQKDPQKQPYGMVTPPLRSSHDLRIIQQALRMNILLGIEVFPGDERYIDTLIEKEILSPFCVSQMIRFRWEKYGFGTINH